MSNILNKDQGLQSGAILPAARDLRSTWVLALGTFAVGTDAFIVSAFLPQMAHELSVPSSVAGHSVTAFALAYALLAPVIATLTAAMERRRLLVGSLVLLGISNIASALSWSMEVLVITRVAAAAFAAAYTPNAGAVAAALAGPQARARALAVVIGGLTVATALGVPIGHVVSAAMSWRASLALVGVVSFVSAIAVFSLMPRLAGGTKVTLRRRLAALRRPRVLAILPLTIVGMAACYTPYAFTLEVLGALRVPASALTFMLFAYGIGAFVGNYLSGQGTDRAGPFAILASTYALMSVSLGALAWFGRTPSAQALVPVAFLMVCWGASSWAQSPAQQHRLIVSAPDEAPLAVALNSSCIYLGMSIGTATGGQLIEQGATVVLACGAGLAGLALAYLLITASHLPATRRHRTHGALRAPATRPRNDPAAHDPSQGP